MFVTDVIKLDGKIVSSTYIRSIIKAGDMEKSGTFFWADVIALKAML